MNKKFAGVVGALAIALFSQTTMAAPITAGSQISTGGTLNVIGGDGSVANATGLDFTNPLSNGSGDGILTGYAGNGDLTAFTCAPSLTTPCGYIRDLPSFSLFNGLDFFINTDANGTTNADTIFSFTLNAPLTVTRVPGTENAAAALILSGMGKLYFNGFDATDGLFTLVTLNNNTGTTTYSATLFSLGTSIPEPGTLLIMGLGLAGLVAARRKSAV